MDVPLNGIIKRIYVSTSGDPSVGISGASATIDADGNFLFDLGVIAEEHQGWFLEGIRKDLAYAFSEMWGDQARILFDFEVEN